MPISLSVVIGRLEIQPSCALSTATNGKPVGATAGKWTMVSALFTVKTAGSYLLAFGAAGRSDSYGGRIDNISVDPAPVLLPAAAVGLMLGLGSLAALRRRRKV